MNYISIMKISKPNSYRPSYKNFFSLTTKLPQHKSSNKDLSLNTTQPPQSNHHRNQSEHSHSFYLCPNTTTKPDNSACQHDFREYRVLMHIFAENINNYYGGEHHDVLGELQQMHRIHLSSEEKKLMEKRLHEVFRKNIDKFMREVLNRNSHNIKECQEYLNAHQKRNLNRQKLSRSSLGQNNLKNSENQEEKIRTKKRPFSSASINKHRLSDKHELNSKLPDSSHPKYNDSTLATIDTQCKNNNTKRNQSKVCIYGDDELVFIAENIRKTFPSNNLQQHSKLSQSRIFKYKNKSQHKNLSSNYDDLRNAGILICETINDPSNVDNRRHNRINQCDNTEQQKDIDRGGEMEEECIDRNYARKAGRPSLENYERMRIQERLFTVNQGNGALIIQSQLQGYGPKSKCWLNKEQKPATKTSSGSCSTINNTTAALIQTRGHKALTKYKTIRAYK